LCELGHTPSKGRGLGSRRQTIFYGGYTNVDGFLKQANRDCSQTSI
jgi:hypothetical protein